MKGVKIMKKKLIALLCSMSLLSAMTPVVMAENANDTAEQAAVLTALGVIEKTASGYATKESYVGSLAGFLYDNGYAAEGFARMTGIIEYGESFNGNDNISVDDALKYAVITLGYKEYAENVESYSKVADSLNLDDGLKDSGDALITNADARTILYNMLECEPMSATLVGNEIAYVKDKNETLLSKYRDIQRVYGRVTADDKTSLSEEKGCKEGYIVIDDTEYVYDFESEETFLGKNIEAYVNTEKNDDARVLYVGERANKNTEITVDAEYIEGIEDDYSAIYYLAEDKEKTLKIAPVPKVIYNGVFYADYETADFMPEVGNIRLVDNDRDGKYDVIFITSYETVIVKAIDTTKKTIYNKYSIEGHIPSLELEPENEEIRYSISDGMSMMSFSDIKKSDVLSVAISKSTENKIVEILVSGESVSGMLGSIDESEMEIVIDDTTYDITPEFIRFKNNETKIISIGTAYTFYLDIFGNVVGWVGSAEDGYAVLYKFYADDLNENFFAVYMNMEGEWLESPFAENVYYKDERYKKAALFEEIQNVRGQIIKIKTNAKGEIKRIETAIEGLKYDKNKLTKTPSTEYTWRSALRSFNCEYFLNDDAKAVVIPTDVKDKDAYQIREPKDYFQSDKKYTVSLYDIDEYNFSGIVSLAYTPRLNNTLLIVKSVNTVCLDDEILDEITGCTSDYEDITVVGKDDKIFDGISGGDVIKISLSPIGRADDTETVYKLKNEFLPMTVSTIYNTTGNVAGKVELIDADKGRMQINCNGTKYNFRIDDTVKVAKYDTKYNDIEICNYLNIMQNDLVFIRLSWGKVQDVIIRK